MCVQTFLSEATIEGLDLGLIRQFARSREVQFYPVLVGPPVGVSEFLCKRGFKSHLRNTFFELDGKTSQRGFPIPNRHRPLLTDIA